MLPADIAERYEFHESRNALAILASARHEEWREIIGVLRGFKLLRSEIMTPGGRKSMIASQLDECFFELGWVEKSFDTRIVVDDDEYIAPTHKVDCYKDRIALEVE